MNLTAEQLKRIAPKGRVSIINNAAPAFTLLLPGADVNSLLRVAHFLAQTAMETDGYKTLEEYASGLAYEGRKTLGNIRMGDGKRYKGRGFIMLTGRANYRSTGRAIGEDLEAHPELAAVPMIAAKAALHYWTSHRINLAADNDDIAAVTRLVNGGLNGLADRKLYLARAKEALGL